jgi:hypothetical protein
VRLQNTTTTTITTSAAVAAAAAASTAPAEAAAWAGEEAGGAGVEAITNMIWDPEKPYRLHVSGACGSCCTCDFTWKVSSHNAANHARDGCTVAVVDGDSLLLTPLNYSLCPPPMAPVTMALPACAQSVGFAPTGEMAVHLANGCIQVFACPFPVPEEADEYVGERFILLSSFLLLLSCFPFQRCLTYI